MKKCPYCAEEIQDEAILCRFCQRPLQAPPQTQPQGRLAGVRKTNKTLFLIVIGSLLVGFCFFSIAVAVSLWSSPEEVRRTPQGVPYVLKKDARDGSPYMALPKYQVSDNSKVPPSINLLKINATPPSGIRDELKRQLGPYVSIKYDAGVETYYATPPKPVGRIREVWVEYYKGKIVSGTAWFEPPAEDWGVALALVGLEPRTTPPNGDAIGASNWRNSFQGIDEVSGLKKPEGKPSLGNLSVTPSRAYASKALKGE